MYGTPYTEDKQTFWSGLASLGYEMVEPWLVCGDLNEILWPHEKVGGKDWSNSRVRHLRAFMEGCSLIDLGFSDHPFTWVKTIDGVIQIQQRLDRFIADSSWLNLWPDAQVRHLP